MGIAYRRLFGGGTLHITYFTFSASIAAAGRGFSNNGEACVEKAGGLALKMGGFCLVRACVRACVRAFSREDVIGLREAVDSFFEDNPVG